MSVALSHAQPFGGNIVEGIVTIAGVQTIEVLLAWVTQGIHRCECDWNLKACST
eukprot:m.1659745 g.1659745  ORF g.1659745 m.1659745 type:complete len:54 (+) comp119727_c0_seq1:46-207(+)